MGDSDTVSLVESSGERDSVIVPLLVDDMEAVGSGLMDKVIDSEPVSCVTRLSVRLGSFVTESLTVLVKLADGLSKVTDCACEEDSVRVIDPEDKSLVRDDVIDSLTVNVGLDRELDLV